MSKILITGANKGIGREAARQLVAAGHTVYLGSRDAERGRRAAEQVGAQPIQIDITDDASVAAAVHTLENEGGLDVLVNNAGMQNEMRPDGSVLGAADLTADMMRETFDTNVFGTVRVLHAFLPLLQKSGSPVIVNVASGLASLARATTPGPGYDYPGVAYRSSKTAVNVLTIEYAKAFPGIRINSVEPGYTKTDLNFDNGAQSVEEAAAIIVRMAQIGADGPTGGFFGNDGPLPW
ncbi:SDR family NAD(P)-dependent oxidoreductase [Nocardia yunnanensis]|uniref:SDR family NAD(P)-dependent oxidoreductase n=1 Tax=Nocardia yunnanensis TaxID=2382165 RepID=A0A386ZG13_9NOCA|nr:SDR family NAD(P)-dependent oxidoreductase [Nocardia yunnanensis]AYF76397.1 SDR family NAD(P)-dependent oxidoreductase [Nocardia yunnanensis]